MSNIIIPKIPEPSEKILMMREDARFEVGGDIDAEATAVSNAMGIAGKPAPATVPKMFLAGRCVFNCAYCGCRCGRDDRDGYVNTPAELAKMAVAEAKRNGNGVFVTSAIHKNADYTQELLAECVRIMRESLSYRGYIHAKVMPGADPALIARTGQYASRLSVNIEVASSAGYSRIAKQKTRANILTPMGNIASQILEAKQGRRRFAISQTTQLMAGSTDEDDRAIMTLSQALYQKYRLTRVYYTPFHYLHEAKGYEDEHLAFKQTPYWRMARLYQADRLLQLYGFTPEDVTPAEDPFLHEDLDPKAAWALRHLDLYPVEVNKADYNLLIRVPGIGITYAKRILEARRYCTVTHDVLRQMRIPLKRCAFFIVCNGIYKGGLSLDSPRLRDMMATGREQLSIFNSLAEGIPGETKS